MYNPDTYYERKKVCVEGTDQPPVDDLEMATKGIQSHIVVSDISVKKFRSIIRKNRWNTEVYRLQNFKA